MKVKIVETKCSDGTSKYVAYRRKLFRWEPMEFQSVSYTKIYNKDSTIHIKHEFALGYIREFYNRDYIVPLLKHCYGNKMIEYKGFFINPVFVEFNEPKLQYYCLMYTDPTDILFDWEYAELGSLEDCKCAIDKFDETRKSLKEIANYRKEEIIKI